MLVAPSGFYSRLLELQPNVEGRSVTRDLI